MLHMKILLVAFALLSCSVLALADDDGNAFLRKCIPAVALMDGAHVPDSMNDADFCMAYVRGVLDLTALWEATDKTKNVKGPFLRACLPEHGVQTGQGIRIVVKYLKEHPELLHNESLFLVDQALMDAFPCKQK
jgi:hypothetical protein